MMATYIGFSLVFLHSLIKLGNTILLKKNREFSTYGNM
jgi:hypothetical protein